MRGAICCWTVTPHCQSYGRIPQPCSTWGFTVVVLNGLPKFEFSHGPQVSMLPVVAGDCAAGSLWLQATAKFWLASVQERWVVCWKVTAGLEIVYCASLFAAWRYLLKL